MAISEQWAVHPTGVGTTPFPTKTHGTPSVHPHGCGDNFAHNGLVTGNGRFTPTGVGTTRATFSAGIVTVVHPHGCGDNFLGLHSRLNLYGSPPRVWGQRAIAPMMLLQKRFTPTGVGTTKALRSPESIEHGSPPRVWGQRSFSLGRGSPRRFTPTGVGTTRGRTTGRGVTAVHPHGCGDNCRSTLNPFAYSGSPPRVWGQRQYVAVIIRLARHWRPVHPHGCGDNAIRIKPAICKVGSPPRVWGQRLYRLDCIGVRRFTPTGVGTTRAWLLPAGRPAVHPHGCGDNGPGTR